MRPRVATAIALGILGLLDIIGTTPARAGTWDAIELVSGHDAVTVLVEGKPRKYFRITPASPLVLPVDGPARLRVISRAEFPPGASGVAAYVLRAAADGRELDRSSTESSLSDMVNDPTAGRTIGKSRRMNLEVGPGHHQVTLSVEGVNSVLLRVHQAAPAKGPEKFVTLSPIEAARSVTVIEGERTIPYASALPGKPVRVRVVGPTTLDLTTRLDYDATMRGTQTYRLRIEERGRRVREAAFKTTRSTTATFGQRADRVPSKVDRLRLKVGPGVHEFSIVLVAPKDGAVEVHARIPEPRTASSR